jgi:hypothetical protein
VTGVLVPGGFWVTDGEITSGVLEGRAGLRPGAGEGTRPYVGLGRFVATPEGLEPPTLSSED